MKYALIDTDGSVAAISEVDSPELWSHPEDMTLVSAEVFYPDPTRNISDYSYKNGEFFVDTERIEERERNRSYEPYEVLTAMFSSQPQLLDALPNEALMHMASYMVEWKSDCDYKIGDKLQYQERPYRVLQNHRSNAAYPPDITASLYARIIASDDPDNPLPWVQPDSTNAYKFGARVTHNGYIWESDYNDNVWEPGVFGWHVVET